MKLTMYLVLLMVLAVASAGKERAVSHCTLSAWSHLKCSLRDAYTHVRSTRRASLMNHYCPTNTRGPCASARWRPSGRRRTMPKQDESLWLHLAHWHTSRTSQIVPGILYPHLGSCLGLLVPIPRG